jgi:SAM-dependent methyltransferase
MTYLIKKNRTIGFVFRSVKNICGYVSFLADFYRYKKQSSHNRFRFPTLWRDRKVCLQDRTEVITFNRHYVLHTAWAARILARTLPEEHVDISSSLQFVTVVSAFIPTRFYDYRPVDIEVSGLQPHVGDLLALPFSDASVPSLSCMHVIEHVGLGRYGDPIDSEGDLKAISELKRVLATKGNLLFVVPVGRPKVVFNAHRVYSYNQIIDYFSGLELKEFALIPDRREHGGLIYNAPTALVDSQTYGCGCFLFQRT